MYVVSRVKCVFIKTIVAYSGVMLEPDTDWEVVSKRIMRDIKFFNTELSYLTNDDEQGEKVESVIQSSTKLNQSPSPTHSHKSNQSHSSDRSFNVDWEQAGLLDFDADDFNPNELFEFETGSSQGV